MAKELTTENYHNELFESDTETEQVQPNEEVDPKLAEPNTEEEVPVETSTETTNEPQEEVEDDLEGVDNPKSYKHFQAIAEKRLVETTQEKMLREQKERELEEVRKELERLKNPPQEEPQIQKPVKPQKPSDYNKVDALTEPDSPSFKWREANEEYLEKLAEYNADIVSQTTERFNRERQLQLQSEAAAKAKAKAIGEIQQVINDPIEAEKAFQWATSEESLTPKVIAEFYQWKKTQGNIKPKTQPKKPATPLPPGVSQGGGEAEVTPDDAFNNTISHKARDRSI